MRDAAGPKTLNRVFRTCRIPTGGGEMLCMRQRVCMCVRCGEAPTLGRMRVSRSRLERGRMCRGDGPTGRLGAMNDDDEKREVRAFGRDKWTTPQPEDYLTDTRAVPLYFEKRSENGEKGMAHLAPCAFPTQASKSGAGSTVHGKNKSRYHDKASRTGTSRRSFARKRELCGERNSGLLL
jgi:hypothetical protein